MAGCSGQGIAGGGVDHAMIKKILAHVSEDCKSELKSALSSRAEIRDSCKREIGEVLATDPRPSIPRSTVQNADPDDVEISVPVEDIQAADFDGPTVVVFVFIACVLLAAIAFCVRSYTELEKNGLLARPAKKLSKQKRLKEANKNRGASRSNF